MKIRTDFVTNSSSVSYIVTMDLNIVDLFIRMYQKSESMKGTIRLGEVSAYYVNDSDFFFFLRKDIVDKLLEKKSAKLWVRLEENRTILGNVPGHVNQPSERYKHISTDCFYTNV